jgi:hypothetical protein
LEKVVEPAGREVLEVVDEDGRLEDEDVVDPEVPEEDDVPEEDVEDLVSVAAGLADAVLVEE